MERLNIPSAWWCGVDIQLRQISACLLNGKRKSRQQPVPSFGPTTSELQRLSAWLHAEGCTHVGLESTGIDWQPIDTLLAERLTLLRVNRQHFKARPGRQTDVADAQWLADWLEHGWLRAVSCHLDPCVNDVSEHASAGLCYSSGLQR
jgi:hypothetical protein